MKRAQPTGRRCLHHREVNATKSELANIFKPNVSVWGYALFQATNATGLWGGVFPFLPASFQSYDMLVAFFMAQAFAFTLAYFASVLGVYFIPKPTRKFLVPLAAIPYFAGWGCVIAGVYLPDAAVYLANWGGLLLGIGAAGFYMLWQRIFAGQETSEGTRDLILGTAYGSILYFALYLIPRAITMLLIPALFTPLFGLCIVLASRKIDLSQTMFNERPREHRHVYLRVLADYWQGSLAIGVIGFSGGVLRSLAISDPISGSILNALSMVVVFGLALGLLVVWQRKSIRFSLAGSFHVFFPFIMAGLFVLPFSYEMMDMVFSSCVYAAFTCATMLLMVSCAGVSRDRGINPIFIYGFTAGIVYTLHFVGFACGLFIEDMSMDAMSVPTQVSFMSIFLLSIVYFMMTGGFSSPFAEHPDKKGSDDIELIARTPAPESQAHAIEDGRVYADRTSKQVALVQQAYGLTQRETEVMELIARGNTVSHIADDLVISENTVRTHSRRIYAKLGIHKKQDLIDLVSSFGRTTGT